MQFLAAVLGIRMLRCCLGLVFRTTATCVLLGLFETCLFVRFSFGDLLGRHACIFLGAAALLLFFLALFLRLTNRLFFLGDRFFSCPLLGYYAFLLLEPHPIQFVLFFLCLLFENIALDIGTLASNLDTDGA